MHKRYIERRKIHVYTSPPSGKFALVKLQTNETSYELIKAHKNCTRRMCDMHTFVKLCMHSVGLVASFCVLYFALRQILQRHNIHKMELATGRLIKCQYVKLCRSIVNRQLTFRNH